MQAWAIVGAAALAAYLLRPRKIAITPSVLVFGDSQAGGAGRGVAQWVRAQGGAARAVSYPGERTEQLAERLASLELDPGTTVVWFTGGNDRPGRALASARAAVQRLARRGVQVVIVLPFPPTEIADMTYARRIWGRVEGADHFARTGYAQRMAQVRRELAQAGAPTVDPTRVFGASDYVTAGNARYPLQRDGLHVRPELGRALVESALEVRA